MFALFTLSFSISKQQKEILIIGTMHKVPKLVKNSYKPLLRYAKRYNPDAIYVEYVRSNDSVGLINDTPKFVQKSDSVKRTFVLNPERFNALRLKNLKEFTKDEFKFMATTYLVNRDNANYTYFNYLYNYGVKGSEKPLRHENGDLSAKLAIALNLTYLYSMDDQKTKDEYHNSWQKCTEFGADNGDNAINQQLGNKQYMSAVAPALIGRFGKHTNKLESLNRLHLLSSFRYVKNENSYCSESTKLWDGRNYRMAKNIAEQVINETDEKNIVIVGAAHVIGLKEALEKHYPELKVKLMYD